MRSFVRKARLFYQSHFFFYESRATMRIYRYKTTNVMFLYTLILIEKSKSSIVDLAVKYRMMRNSPLACWCKNISRQLIPFSCVFVWEKERESGSRARVCRWKTGRETQSTRGVALQASWEITLLTPFFLLHGKRSSLHPFYVHVHSMFIYIYGDWPPTFLPQMASYIII